MITTEEMERMIIDIQSGAPDPQEDAEHADMRRRLREEIAALEDEGHMVDVPPEIA